QVGYCSLSHCTIFRTFFCFSCYGATRDLPSFPTRRSSDLEAAAGFGDVVGRTGEGEADPAVAVDRVEIAARGHRDTGPGEQATRSEEHTSELQSLAYLVCRLLLEKKKKNISEPSVHERDNM